MSRCSLFFWARADGARRCFQWAVSRRRRELENKFLTDDRGQTTEAFSVSFIPLLGNHEFCEFVCPPSSVVSPEPCFLLQVPCWGTPEHTLAFSWPFLAVGETRRTSF